MWYLAEIIQEIRVGRDPRIVCHINSILIEAVDDESAYKAAIQYGEERNMRYKNISEQQVKISFLGLGNITAIHDDLEHEAEIGYREIRTKNRNKILQLIKKKNELGIFRPRRPRLEPDYMAAEIALQLREVGALPEKLTKTSLSKKKRKNISQ